MKIIIPFQNKNKIRVKKIYIFIYFSHNEAFIQGIIASPYSCRISS